MKQCAKIVVFIVLAAFCFACENNYISPIPDMPVVLDIVIMSDAPELNVIGGFKEFREAQKCLSIFRLRWHCGVSEL